MKLFTSLTASAAFAQAQDFPGFGGSLADLLAQLNIENQLDLGIGAQAGNDAVVNATDGEFDPITGERYLIANTPDEDDPFTNDCTGNFANTAAEHCNPCVFDPSVCNGDPSVCVATQNGQAVGIPLGINDNGTPGDTSDDWWKYNCQCDNHSNPKHRTDPGDDWAGPDCQCTVCKPHDGSDSGEDTACTATDPCTVLAAENGGADNPNIDTDLSETGNTEICTETPNTNDFTCPCDDGFHGVDCNNPLPCAADNGQSSSVCNDANGTNVNPGLANESCTCDCLTQSQNEAGGSTNIMNGPNCDQTICEFAPRPSNCNSKGTLTNSHSTDNPSVLAECTCTCDPNYSGDDCENYACADTTCNNGGTVNDSVDGQCTCDCPAEFTGAQCETPVNTPTGTGCWKCDAMTYVQCATEGTFQTCSEDNRRGDNGVCFVEYREQNQKLTQLCTGCKDAKDCLKNQNDNIDFLKF